MLFDNAITTEHVGLCKKQIEQLGQKIEDAVLSRHICHIDDICSDNDLDKAAEILIKLPIMLGEAYNQGYYENTRNIS